ncbi:hypothetical protein HZH66_003232 [Vespula vulgaris]|uniref:Uncharacterized protein n=1 Tax=Vespula vulgaris TaxID=7454 RepID=A0A834NGY9_VESVU|nr:hypothetical protein HZH66_003232 [Vespula vulgaris]
MGNIANLLVQLPTRGAVNHIELQHMQPMHLEIFESRPSALAELMVKAAQVTALMVEASVIGTSSASLILARRPGARLSTIGALCKYRLQAHQLRVQLAELERVRGATATEEEEVEEEYEGIE